MTPYSSSNRTGQGIHPPAALLKVLAVAPRLIQHTQLRPVALPGSSAAAHARPLFSRPVPCILPLLAQASKPPATQYYRSPAPRLHCLTPVAPPPRPAAPDRLFSPDRRPCADSSRRSLNWAPIASLDLDLAFSVTASSSPRPSRGSFAAPRLVFVSRTKALLSTRSFCQLPNRRKSFPSALFTPLALTSDPKRTTASARTWSPSS
ncbi:hypothetical protein V8C26DRAFT_214784 [Trichoderma gracile]